MYIYQNKDWANFTWDDKELIASLGNVRNMQGLLLGKMVSIGFDLRDEAMLDTLTIDIVKTSEIEGVILNPDSVRSSIAMHLGLPTAGIVASDRNVDGVVQMTLDATQNFNNPLTFDRLFDWHAALFPTGRSGMFKIDVGSFRSGTLGPMMIVSGAAGKEKVHYQAPDANVLDKEMSLFINWFNNQNKIDPLLKAAIAHLWFVAIHPFGDGNGRIGRAITDMLLARSDGTNQRFYSMSAQIKSERNNYYNILEQTTNNNSIDITNYLKWFLSSMSNALIASEKTLSKVLDKAHFWNLNSQVSLNDRQKNIINKLFDGFEGNLNNAKWAKINKCSSDTALRDINDLIVKNILSKDETSGGRSTNYNLIFQPHPPLIPSSFVEKNEIINNKMNNDEIQEKMENTKQTPVKTYPTNNSPSTLTKTSPQTYNGKIIENGETVTED